MTKSKTPGQLSLFDTGRYERSQSHYDIEDGYETEEIWPKFVSESSQPLVTPVSESSQPLVTPVSESSPDSITSQNDDSITSQNDDSITTTNPCGAVGRYRAGGNTRGGGEYWRFSYRDGRRVKHVHIPGGCSSNPIALARANKVREVINLGATVEEVLKLIQNW